MNDYFLNICLFFFDDQQLVKEFLVILGEVKLPERWVQLIVKKQIACNRNNNDADADRSSDLF